MKVLYGIRYDLFDVPSARTFAPESVLAGLHDRQEQLRAARRVFVVARRARDDGAPRIDGADVRAAAHRLLRQRDSQQRRSASLHGDRGRFGRRRAAVSDEPRQRARRVRPSAPEHHRGRSGLRDAVRVADQRPGRARAAQRHVARGGLRQLDRPQPARADGRQPDSDRSRRWPTAGRCTRPPSARRRASIRRSIT